LSKTLKHLMVGSRPSQKCAGAYRAEDPRKEILPIAKLPVAEWEKLMLDVAASKIDRATTTQRLRKLLKRAKKVEG
jgi:hypothetical protein